MVRQARNVLVFLFRMTVTARPEYAVFRRSDDANWQPVSGGVEDSEDLIAAARRETAEETGLPGTSRMYQLDMVSGVEKACFAEGENWPGQLYIVSKHYFAVDVGAETAAIRLSHEHHEFRWLAYGQAYAALRYDDDKTALWELNARIRARDLREPGAPRVIDPDAVAAVSELPPR
jgi:dihydroneopterin triphosphate diphosphatase